MALHGKARDEYAKAISERKPFKGGAAIHGVEGKSWSTGRLPEDWAGKYIFDDVAYTVLSYGTPIAWVNSNGERVIPDVSYSRTTSGHQTFVKSYL